MRIAIKKVLKTLAAEKIPLFIFEGWRSRYGRECQRHRHFPRSLIGRQLPDDTVEFGTIRVVYLIPTA
jgi:hypothetical protein